MKRKQWLALGSLILLTCACQQKNPESTQEKQQNEQNQEDDDQCSFHAPESSPLESSESEAIAAVHEIEEAVSEMLVVEPLVPVKEEIASAPSIVQPEVTPSSTLEPTVPAVQ